MSADHPTLRTVRAPAMGGTVTITADASPVSLDSAFEIVATLESRWSRFRATSELRVLNRHRGPTMVQPSTARVIEVALAGRALTCGWFDPTVGTGVKDAGYRRSVDEGWCEAVAPSADRAETDPVVDPELGLVDVPHGMELDLGGIGKGSAADTAATLLFESGASFVGVEIGGDIRIRSRHRAVVDVEPPGGNHAASPLRLGLRDGGVAVSGPTKRRGGVGHHHLIDPFTGRPVSRPRVAAVVAASAAGAEMLATAAAVAPLDDAVHFVERAGATAWLIESSGHVVAVGEPDRFILDAGWLGEHTGRKWAR